MEGQGNDWRVPGYTEVRELGSGGSGRVVLARHEGNETYVAIKYLNPRLLDDEEIVAKFRAEAELIATIDDPHIARLYEYVEGERGAAIVMELVDGVTLRHLIEREGPTGPEAALVLLKGSLLGLAAAHRLGVVHRDFKPENIIVTADGDSKLVDFGVAVLTGQVGETVGTPPYMAPEQWTDGPAGPATDVYAATITFFECLAGVRPFRGETIAALAYQHQHMPPPLERVPEGLRGLVQHGLAKRPEDRPSSAEAFLRELEESAAAAYGEGWEEQGRAGLRALSALHTGVFPLAVQPAPDVVGTAFAQTKMSPAVKIGLSGALVVTTAAAIIGAFTILNEPPTTTTRAAPTGTRPTTAPPATAGPATPVPSVPPSATPKPTEDETLEPETTRSPEPARPVARDDGDRGPRGARARPPRRVTRPSSRPRPTARPTRRPTTRPTTRPTRTPTTRPSPEPSDEPTQQPTSGPGPSDPGPTPPPQNPNPGPPPEQPGGDPAPEPPPPSQRREALIGLDLSIEADTPLLRSNPDLRADASVSVLGEDGLLGIELGVNGGVFVAYPVLRRWRRRRGPYGEADAGPAE